MKDISEGK